MGSLAKAFLSRHKDKRGSTAHHKKGGGRAEAVKVGVGDWIHTQAGLRGKVVGKGTIGRQKWPAFKVDMGGGRLTAVLQDDAKLWWAREDV